MNQPINQGNQGYPPPNHGYPPPQNVGYAPPPNQGYPPPNQNYPPPVQGYAPPQNNLYFQPPGFVAAPPQLSGISKLANLPAIYIKQKFEKWEALTGCETPNVYYVYPADINGLLIPNSSPLFVAKEKSQCLQRICCPQFNNKMIQDFIKKFFFLSHNPDSVLDLNFMQINITFQFNRGDLRAFDMHIYEFTNGVDHQGKANQVEVMKFSRQYKCTFMCIGRPEMQVYNLDRGGSVPLGKIFSPYLLFNVGVDVFNQEMVPKYTIDGTCCQPGILCRGFPCKSCQQVRFDVLDYNTKQPIVPLLKKSSGCLKACCGDVDDFSVIFPVHSTTEDKALLMSAAIYFEENPQTDTKGGLKLFN